MTPAPPRFLETRLGERPAVFAEPLSGSGNPAGQPIPAIRSGNP